MTKINSKFNCPLNRLQQSLVTASYLQLGYSVCSSTLFQEYERLIKNVPNWKEVKRTLGKAECQRQLALMESLGLEQIKTQFIASKNQISVPISDGQQVMQITADKRENLQQLAERLNEILRQKAITISSDRIAFFRNGKELNKTNLIKTLRLDPQENLQLGATLKISMLTGRSFVFSLPFHTSYEDFDAEVCRVDAKVCNDSTLETTMRGMSRYYISKGMTLEDEAQSFAVEATLWGDRSTPITRVLKLRGC